MKENVDSKFKVDIEIFGSNKNKFHINNFKLEKM